MVHNVEEISLHPAKRVLLLYLLALLLALAHLGLAFLYLESVVGMGAHFLMLLWLTITIVGVGFLCYAALWNFTCSYKLNDECVTGSIGILSREHVRIGLSQIVDYRIMRSITERIICIGDLHINTAGRDNDELIMRQIANNELEHAVTILDRLLNIEQHKSG
ncbi:MAG: PH domain-containing protein [bacterium]|nr:PH domain-containing protein [bacterium]